MFYRSWSLNCPNVFHVIQNENHIVEYFPLHCHFLTALSWSGTHLPTIHFRYRRVFAHASLFTSEIRISIFKRWLDPRSRDAVRWSKIKPRCFCYLLHVRFGSMRWVKVFWLIAPIILYECPMNTTSTQVYYWSWPWIRWLQSESFPLGRPDISLLILNQGREWGITLIRDHRWVITDRLKGVPDCE